MALLQKAYLGATPLFKDIAWYENYSAIIHTVGGSVTVTADTAAHTKGAWSQLIASTSANTSYIYFLVGSVSTTNTDTSTLIDFATGASGSEVAFASNICVGGAVSTIAAFPIKIASGQRISARIQSVVTGGKTASVQTIAMDTGDYNNAPTSVDVIGADTATSTGTAFSGASGTWVEATASTSRAYKAVGITVAVQDSNTANVVNALYTVGVGASASEIEFGNSRVNITANEVASIVDPRIMHFGRNIPAGSRLAVKHAIAANPSKYGFTLIGIP